MSTSQRGGAPKPLPFDCIGFDLDGTLLHTGRELAASLNHALSEGGYAPIDTDMAISLIGGGAGAMLSRALGLYGVEDDGARDALLPALLDHYAAHLGSDTDIYPGLLDALDTLADRGVRLAVVTNKAEGLSRALLDKIGLSDRFELLIGGDTLGPDRKKPKPDMLQFMLRSMNAQKALFIGDSEFDVLAARAAEIPCITVTFGYATEDLGALGAQHNIDRYDELLPLLERW